MELARGQYEDAVRQAREAYKHDISELEQKIRSGSTRKDEQAAIEAEILRIEAKLRDSLARTPGSNVPASEKPTAAEARSALAAATAKFPKISADFGEKLQQRIDSGVDDEGHPLANQPVSMESDFSDASTDEASHTQSTTADLLRKDPNQQARYEGVRAAARKDAADYGLRPKGKHIGDTETYQGKVYNVMNQTAEGRARNADVLAKAAGVEAERDALRDTEAHLINKEHEHYEKGILHRGLRNLFGGSRAERKVAERTMNDAALSYAAKLESSLKERLDEKFRATGDRKYQPGTAERMKIEARYRQTVASRDVTERGDKAREAARKEALASRSLNVAEIAALGSLRYLAEVNKGLEKRAGKTGARVIRALVISGGAAGIAACFGPVAAGAMLSAVGYRAARAVVGGSLGAIGGGLTGAAYEKTLGKRAAVNLKQQYGQQIRSIEDIQTARRAYEKGNVEAIRRKTKYAEILGAVVVGGGFSLGSAYALADAHFIQGLEHSLATLKHDVADLQMRVVGSAHAMQHIPGADQVPGSLSSELHPKNINQILQPSQQTSNLLPGEPVPRGSHPTGWHVFTPVGVDHSAVESSSGLAGTADHYHNIDALGSSDITSVSVEIPNGLGWEAGVHGLFDRLHEMGVDTSFPPHSDIARLAEAAAKGSNVFTAELHKLALEHHMVSANGSMVIPKGARFGIDGNGDVAMHTLSRTGAEQPLPYSTPPVASHIPPSRHVEVDARHVVTPEAGEKETTESLNQQSLDNARRGVNMPIVEHGAAVHELTADRLNEYVLQHPGARGPFIIGPHGEILGEAPHAHETLVGTEQLRAPVFTRVGEPVPAPHGGVESLMDQSGGRVDIASAKVYLTPEHAYAVYGGTTQQRAQAVIDFLYKNPGKTVWEQGDGLMNGQPYIQPVSSTHIDGQVAIILSNQIQPDQIGKVIVPENLLRPAP